MKKGINGFVGIKIDTQKTYDSVDWKVLSHILFSFGFLKRVVNLLSQCPWQGDPFFYFLFIILLELLSRMLYKLEEEGKIQGIKIGRSNLAILHLFFVDDLMIFCRANGENVTHIAECLSQFCKWTGQLISVSKSGCVFLITLRPKSRLKLNICLT